MRVSVTDRCNLRCVYCNPLGGGDFLRHEDILRFEEIERIVRLFTNCGIRRVRLTGGEPLVRRNIVELVSKVSRIPGVDDLSLTTNGVLLGEMANELKRAGLMRINVSVDSAGRGSCRRITGFDVFDDVMVGIRRAIDVGLSPVRVNAVILRRINDGDIAGLARLSAQLPIAVRFIEYCPTGGHTTSASEYVANADVREIIERRFGPLSNVVQGRGGGPALYFRIRGAAGTIGFISGRSSMFCERCTRLRLTSDGKVRPCLYSGRSYDVKRMIRAGARDEDITAILKKIISEKGSYTKLNSAKEDFSMRCIGG